MMTCNKTFILVVVIMLLAALLAPASLAQDPPASPLPTPATGESPPTFELPKELPATATEGLEVVRAFILFASSLATIYVVKGIKALPALKDDEKSKLAGLGADAVAGFCAVVLGIVMAYAAIAAGFLDKQGFWTVLKWALASWPTTWAMYRGLRLSEYKAT